MIHSVKKIGLWTFENYAPFEGSGLDGSCLRETPKPAKFENSQIYRCDKGIEFFDAGALQIVDSVVAECAHAGIEWKRLWTVGWDNEEKGALIKDVTIAARTSNYIDAVNEVSGILIPAQSGLLIDGIDFIGYGLENSNQVTSRAVGGTLIQCIHAPGNGAFELRTKNVRWFSTSVKANSRWRNDVQIRDLDGSFAEGQPGRIIMSDVEEPNFYANLGCTSQAEDSDFTNGMTICPASLPMHHFRLNGVRPIGLHNTDLTFTIDGNSVSIPWEGDGRNDVKQGWTLLTPKNTKLELNLQDFDSIDDFKAVISLLDVRPNDYNILQFNNVENKPDEIQLDSYKPASEIGQPLDQNSAHNDWHYNDAGKFLQIMVKNEGDRPWATGYKPVFNGDMVSSIDENSENIHPFNFFYRHRSCGGPCVTEAPPVVTPPFVTIPDDRPDIAIFSSKMPFGDPYTIENYGIFRPTDENSNKMISAGDNIYVKQGTWLVLDDAMPRLGNVIVLGVLEISTEIRELRLKNLLVFGGKVTIKQTLAGGRSSTSPLRIIFEGDDNDENFILGPDDNFGTKGLLCYGICDFFSNSLVSHSWSLLDGDVSPGDTSITCQTNTVADWPIGGRVKVLSTSFDRRETEELTIANVEGETLTFTTPVQNFHRGSVDSAGLESQIAEIYLMDSKPVIFEGEATSPGFGARVSVGSMFMDPGVDKDTPAQYNGQADFRAIQFKNFGQFSSSNLVIKDDPTYAVVFKNTDNENNQISHCLFDSPNMAAIGIYNSRVEAKRNVIFEGMHGGIEMFNAQDSVVEHNLVAHTLNLANWAPSVLGQEVYVPEKEWPAAIRDKTKGSFVRYNRVAYSNMIGISFRGVDCDSNEIPNSSNKVRGAQFGYFYKYGGKTAGACERIRRIDISHSYLVGALVVLDSMGTWPTGKLLLEEFSIGNSGWTNTFQQINKKMGERLDDEKFTQDDMSITWKNSDWYGQTENFSCDVDYAWDLPEYNNYNTVNKKGINEFFKESFYKTSFTTAYIGNSGGSEIPMYMKTFETANFNGVRERTVFDGIRFYNVGGTDYVCDKSKPSYWVVRGL